MRVRINIGLDFDGTHTFEWEPSNDAGAVEIPRSTLERWAAERRAFELAHRRWQHVVEEVDDVLYHTEQRRALGHGATGTTAKTAAAGCQLTPNNETVAAVAVAKKSPTSRRR